MVDATSIASSSSRTTLSLLARSAAAIQDIWDNCGCICNTLEIAEESGTAGGNPKVALQAQQLNSLLGLENPDLFLSVVQLALHSLVDRPCDHRDEKVERCRKH